MIYVVRHGETDANLHGIVHSVTDTFGLNETGRRQATEAAWRLRDVKFDLCFSSPLKRAQQTAQVILEAGKGTQEIITDERLIERDFGEFEFKTYKPVADFDIESFFSSENKTKKYEKAENILSSELRIHSFLDEIREKYRGKNILITTHASVYYYFRTFYFGEPENGTYREKVSNCGITEYDNN